MSDNQLNQYRIGLLKYNAIALGCIGFFMIFAIASLFAGEANLVPFFLFFVSLGILMLAIASRAEVNEETITIYSIVSKYQINWNEIKSIELGASMFVFHGEGNKRLLMPLAHMWSGKQKDLASKLMDKKITDFEIKLTQNGLADYKIHKNVKI